MEKLWKKAGLGAAGISMAAVMTACGGGGGGDSEESGGSDDSGSSEESSSGGGFGEEVDYTITGIDAGAGIMSQSQQAIEDYGLSNWNLQSSSGAAMTSALGDAIENEEPIIVTGWTPHWKFAEYDLKYLEDPEGSFGDGDDIHTVVRQGLEEDMPGAYQFLDQFQWEAENMEEIMVEIQDGTEPAEAAATWVDENEDMVSEWTDGVEEVDGEAIELVYVAWDSEIASTNVVGEVLTDLGYDVTLTQLEAGPMFAAVADGEADGMVAGWFPNTHASQMEEYGDDYEDLGANLEGAITGLVVPEYMDIDSIEDLEAEE